MLFNGEIRRFVLARSTEKREDGFSVIELITVFAIVSILTGLLAYGYKSLDRPAENGALQTMGFIKKARAKALATTWAYTIEPAIGGGGLTSKYGKNCSATTWTNDPKLSLSLPKGVLYRTAGWSICFTTRGLTDSSVSIPLMDSTGLTKTVNLAAGGGTKIL